MDAFQSKIFETTEKIEKSNNASAEIEEKLENVLEALNIKIGGDGTGGTDGDSGTNIVMKMKLGIKNIKEEIDFITVQSGVLSSILLSRNLLQMKENLISENKKQLLRRNYGKNPKNKKYDEDENSFENL